MHFSWQAKGRGYDARLGTTMVGVSLIMGKKLEAIFGV